MPRPTKKCGGCGRDLTEAQLEPGGHACGPLACSRGCGSAPIEAFVRVIEAYCECGSRLTAAV